MCNDRTAVNMLAFEAMASIAIGAHMREVGMGKVHCTFEVWLANEVVEFKFLKSDAPYRNHPTQDEI